MNHLIRLVYASRSTQASQRGSVESSIGSILAQSRRNNQKDQIGGVLFFGDGYFFQCLEGEESQVLQTYARITRDSRHTGATILQNKPITKRLFNDWSMKYVPAAHEVQALLKREGYRRFVPLEFSLPMIEMLLDYFQRAQAGEALPTIAANEEPVRKGFWNRMTGWLRA
ncbi:blue light sensor protein [Venatoribacter cucullus]|uniref:Blue light sensor protein n=1 Tax=Venatoribacter cucullus TaxID=2661630 RepID=A0A9X7UV67_9GAMM|nr:BLUF domain-containing protein [Venatoribacter cucullus]QQD23662.1 blue light sensor protein [Venatoribacter cucullus]